MMHPRLARPLSPELAKLLGVENQVNEQGGGGMETVVVLNEGYQIAEVPLANFPCLPSIGESWRQGGLLFKVVNLVYNAEEGMIEIHVKQGV